MKHEQFILRNLSRLDLVSKRSICMCVDGGGQLLFDYRKKQFIFKGRCKLILICTMIRMNKFKAELRRSGIEID